MTTNKSQAWTYTAPFPDGFKLSHIDVPTEQEAQASNKLLIKVHAAALNPVDVQAMNLSSKNGKQAEYGIGADFSGTVLFDPSKDSTRFAKGDEVMGITFSPLTDHHGTLSQVAVLDAAGTAFTRKPAAWSFEQAASIPLVWLTAQASIESVEPYVTKSSANVNVVVLGGSSATGIYTIMLAKKRGWNVLTTSSSRNKSFVMDTLGADQHVDYTKEDVRKCVEAFAPSAIIDCVGGTECIGIRGNKRYVSIVGDKVSRTTMGGPYTYYDWRAPVYMTTQWLRWLKGYVGLGESYDVIHLALKKEQLDEATKMLYPDNIYIDKTFSFDQAKEAYEHLNTGRAKGKVVVRVV